MCNISSYACSVISHHKYLFKSYFSLRMRVNKNKLTSFSGKIGDACKWSSFCADFISFSKCHQDRCICKRGYVEAGQLTMCRISR